jgi:hypothetical protein
MGEYRSREIARDNLKEIQQKGLQGFVSEHLD